MEINMPSNSCDCVIPHQTRKIKPTRRSVSGIYAFRGDRQIAYESTLERDFLIRKEYGRSVLDIIPQPCKITFTGHNGHSYTYTPDFLVYYRLGDMIYPDYPKPILVEVKPKEQWQKHWRKWLPKWKAACRYAKEQGWIFHIHDESRIRDQTFKNIRFLERYKRMQFSVEESRQVIESVQHMGSVSFHYLLSLHFLGIYKAEGISHLWYLLATRQLDCDITKPLNDFTEFWVPPNE